MDALPLIERHLEANRDDRDAQYVLLHALYASFVHQKGTGATAEGKARFTQVARAYVDAKSRHATLVSEWLAVVEEER